MAKRTEVLIVGSGSAGISAGVWLARYGIPCTILERRNGPLEIGQADGVQCRTVEIYESFGISEELVREAYHVTELAFWVTKEGSSGISRERRAADTPRGWSHQPHVILNQAKMNKLMLGAMERFSDGKQGIEYGVSVKSVEVDEEKASDPEAYAVKVVAERDGKEEVWEAKYVLGCDGAHSLVRKSLGYQMIGDSTDTVWGVMDIFPQTNFPDIRRKCTIHSAAGNLVIIPREGGDMVRFYIQLPPGARAKDVKLEDLQATAKKIFAPYVMDFANTFWWSAYPIGQRLADHFHKAYRVFLTGDACHTHSPKAGQGMNVSLQDGHNIGWKLGSVLTGRAPPSLLKTYVSERGSIAKKLIDFDRNFSSKFNQKETFPGEFSKLFIESLYYTAGLTTQYEQSEIIDADGSKQGIAKGVEVGMRFPSAIVIRFCDAKAMQLQRALQGDGRWRVVVFGGKIQKGEDGKQVDLQKLADGLEPIARKFTPPNADIDSLIEPLLVLQGDFTTLEQDTIPSYFWPVTGKWKIRDIHKIYVDGEHYTHDCGHAYEKYGVDPEQEAMVIVRPDQYVAKVLEWGDVEGVERFFGGVFLENGR
ncbi:phenol 2-monooxygenase [Lophiotrema nucula]|uniref:Phenol 2-monooxygenase n=1 Tax=Lophiotrema nucula TaxID=690887 RepID=A0A6A5YXK2_9PLEO|nr:phenol 2-monooxygenase [Lophiotrema nucula]